MKRQLLILLMVLHLQMNNQESVYGCDGCKKTFNDYSLTQCTKQCSEVLLGHPIMIDNDPMRFACCQKYEYINSTNCVQYAETECHKGNLHEDEELVKDQKNATHPVMVLSPIDEIAKNNTFNHDQWWSGFLTKKNLNLKKTNVDNNLTETVGKGLLNKIVQKDASWWSSFGF